MRKETTDIGDNYTVEYNYKNPNVEVYRSSITKRKLNGEVIRRAVGMYDSTLNFTLIGNFEKGLLMGIDSIFRNDTLIRIENYLNGIKNGDQIEIRDSIKTVSPYSQGVINGFQSIYVNHRIQKRSYFNQGVKDSTEFYYDSLGQVATTFRYHFDHDNYWESHLDLDRHELVSFFEGDKLNIELLRNAEYRGSIVFYSHDPKGIGNVWHHDVIHESITQGKSAEYEYSRMGLGYFYIVDENSCIVCDYIDYEGIWVAYSDGIELKFFELRKLY